jgi:hypothetical protein
VPVRIAVALLLVAGCDRLFALEHIPPGGPGDAPFDTPPADAFDPDLQCPATYTLALWPGSRFRIVTPEVAPWTASDDCNDDLVGATHLAVAPTSDKLAVLVGKLVMQNDTRWWLGAVQPLSVNAVTEHWLWVTGEPVDVSLWGPNEPDDVDGLEIDHFEQFGAIDTVRSGMFDYPATTPNRALCECDGRAFTDEARVAIEQSQM